LLAAIAPAAV